MYNETITLPNGIAAPKLGLGTWLIPDDAAAEAVRQAAAIGYRHFDTAQAYGNERGVSEGVRTCGVPREELFVVSKVAAEHKSYAAAKQSIEKTLAVMELDYLDLMIIHSPQPWVEVNQSENRYFEENREVWRALEDAYEAGKLRAIGVSNFLRGDIDSLRETARVKPMVNQILAHISNTPLDLISYCADKGMILEAYSPVAHGEAIKNPQIARMAEKYRVTIPQLCIRYDLQLGMIALPKTANPEHMKINAAVDFVISDEDMESLKAMERIRDYGEASRFAVFGGKLNRN
ncbi:aldo/keto reductase [Selenomonas sp. TAMA-11512]|uniref:aldo/keto reductase n=1 Tax=Selenomonas sp. TAMA-11512 TaxID=3095337 RepID=UPI00308CFA4F|nr:aldo/keto reductase [Selenomonas sp. TAMA-11512]